MEAPTSPRRLGLTLLFMSPKILAELGRTFDSAAGSFEGFESFDCDGSIHLVLPRSSDELLFTYWWSSLLVLPQSFEHPLASWDSVISCEVQSVAFVGLSRLLLVSHVYTRLSKEIAEVFRRNRIASRNELQLASYYVVPIVKQSQVFFRKVFRLERQTGKHASAVFGNKEKLSFNWFSFVVLGAIPSRV